MDPEITKRSRKEIFVFFSTIMIPMYLAVSEQTVIATVLPVISSSLGRVELIAWIATSYLVALTFSSPVYGVIGDIFGRKITLLIGLGIYCLGSIACGLSTSMEMLIAARALQGIGAGGLMTNSQALIGDFIPARERGYYQGYLSMVMMAGTTGGPLVGAVLAEAFGWRSIFVANLMLSILAILLASRLQTLKKDPGSKPGIDLTGIFIFIVFVISLMIGLTLIKWPEPDLAGIALTLSLAAISFAALIAWEKRAAAPFLPLGFLRQPAMWRTNALALFHGATIVPLVTMLPIFLKVGRGMSIGQSAMLLAMMSICTAFGGLATGWLVSKTGRTNIYPAVGMAFASLALFYLALASSAPIGAMTAALCVIGACLGTTMTVVQISAQHIAGPSAYGIAAGFAQFSRSIGAAIGVTLVTMVFFVVLALASSTAMETFGTLLSGGPDALHPDHADEAGAIRYAITGSFALMGILSSLGALVCWRNPVQRI